MGRTQRKSSKYLELYRKALKKKVISILGFTPPSTSEESFLQLFEEVYPDEVRSMEKHYQFYQEKNKKRKTGKPLFFPRPVELLNDISGNRIRKISESTWNVIEAGVRKKEALREAKLEQERRKDKYRSNNISTQEVNPQYITTLIEKYWNECSKILRLYIVKECAKYKNSRTILFFRQVLYGENDWFIKNAAFRILQRFDEVVYLPPKGSGKREKYNTLVDMFGCDYIEDIGKGPIDIMNELYENNYIQTLRDFDVFISHSISNAKVVDDIVQRLNHAGLVAFVDWKSDGEDLKRSKSNQYTADVLQLRMRQSKSLLLLRTKESDISIWASWELGYFAALGRKMAVFNLGDALGQAPEFICGCPQAHIENNILYIEDGEISLDFVRWLNQEATQDGQPLKK